MFSRQISSKTSPDVECCAGKGGCFQHVAALLYTRVVEGLDFIQDVKWIQKTETWGLDRDYLAGLNVYYTIIVDVNISKVFPKL